MQRQASEIAEVPTRVEMVADGLSARVIHGWHSSRLIRFRGALYACATLDADDEWKAETVFLRRERSSDWKRIARFPHAVYSLFAAPDGRFWVVAPSGYEDASVYRMRRPLDFGSFERVYQGTSFYHGAGISPEGNFLLLWAESNEMTAFKPNVVLSAFYDRAADRWHMGRIVTPEGRYGYVGILLRGKSALAVLNSAIQDPQANQTPPHYSWRHVRLARSDDLTRGSWQNVPYLMPRYGNTALQDLMVAPDRSAYLSYLHAGGNSLEETAKKAMAHCISRIRDDLSATIYSTSLSAGQGRLFSDRRRRWFLVGRQNTPNLHLWELDAKKGFRPVREYELPGTERLQEYVIHTLRPERFGGEADGDTIHLMTADHTAAADGRGKTITRMWHAAFRLPR